MAIMKLAECSGKPENEYRMKIEQNPGPFLGAGSPTSLLPGFQVCCWKGGRISLCPPIPLIKTKALLEECPGQGLHVCTLMSPSKGLRMLLPSKVGRDNISWLLQMLSQKLS
jgi:hypothetical protein